MNRNVVPQRSMDEAARRFIAELLRHFYQDPPDVQEDPAEAAA